MTLTSGVFSSVKDDWRTPPDIVAIVERALGGIDLDPCAPLACPRHTGAASWFTSDDDGLSRPWHGRVYMNPPYGRQVAAWIEKAITEVYAGHADAVLVLVAARPDTQWFRPLFRHPIAFLHPRVRFLDERGEPGPSPAFPSALALVRRSWTADDLDRFAAAVGTRGTVMTRWEAI